MASEESKLSKLFRDFAEFFNLKSQAPKAKSARRASGLTAEYELSDEVISFTDFIAIRLPDEYPSPLAKDADREHFTITLAQKARSALIANGMENYSLVEVYMPASAEKIINDIYKARPDGLKKFEEVWQTEFFGLDSLVAGPGDSRVYVVKRVLAFHAAFDPILNKRLIVRPLGAAATRIPPDPTNADFKKDQLLIGMFQIFGYDRTKIGEAPIWAWRSIKEQNSISIDVDFDLMTRAFTDAGRHLFPLGLTLRCSFKQMSGSRMIDNVAVDISGAKKWIEYLAKVHKEDYVTYHIDVGGGSGYEKNDLKYHRLDSININPEVTGQDFPLGTDDQGRERKIPINRAFSIFIKTRDKSYGYQLGFFERALNYVPAKNIMRVTGQLIPAQESTQVMLAPGGSWVQEPIFSLTPIPSREGRFRLEVLGTSRLDITRNRRERLVPGGTIEVEIGDEIQATSSSTAAGHSEEHEFKIQDLRDVPEEVCNRENRPYAAFVEMIPPQERQFILNKEHVFGCGQAFSEDCVSMSPNALLFKRPWVFLSMSAGKGQEVFYFDKTARTTGLKGKGPIRRLSEQGVELDLNAVYEVYLGDFRLELNLKATPSSSFV
jgi:hypothetical protein